MLFEDGSRVEVLRKQNGGYGSWFPAKIVSQIRWYVYRVRYELYLTKKVEPVEEDVHAREIRPCPPTASGEENWVIGDIAEVFDLRSWRVGRIAKVLDKNYFVVRLLGSDELKKFHISNLRVRQVWYDDRWMLPEKVSEKKGNANISKYPTYMDSQADELRCEKARTKQNPNQAYACPFRPGCSVPKRRLTPEPPSRRAMPRKVDTSPSPSQIVEENIECSVASCSGDNPSKHIVQNTDIIKHSREASDSSSDDNTTLCAPKNGKSAVNVHELELHVYKSTVHALYASGPLSWEQESLLTNLRMSLHISNEEHLLQLKNLLSA